jgi:hypothetical protein
VRLVSYQVTIAAPIKVVWAHLTTAEGLVRWVGPEATADPAPGGVLGWTHPNGARVVGSFWSWSRVDGWSSPTAGRTAASACPPGARRSRSTSSRRTAGRPCAWVHHGLPPEAVEDHERGWTYFLGVLRDTLV